MKYDFNELKIDLLEHGMVSEHFPFFINSKGISNIHFNHKEEHSVPCEIFMKKDSGGDRVISLPNPVSYQILVNHIFSDPDVLTNIFDKIEGNDFSNSNILEESGDMFRMPVNDVKSNIKKSKLEKMKISIGKKYCLKYDIESFYENIYTHYLKAGYFGFEQAQFLYKTRASISDTWTIRQYEYMDLIDLHTSNLCRRETKGILTGPFTSRIFSELLMCEIDKDVANQANNMNFRRYVDDVEMYFASRDKLDKSFDEIKKVLRKYKLELKNEKTKILTMPYIDSGSFKFILNMAKKKKGDDEYSIKYDDLFETLDYAVKLYNDGTKGALNYTLKVLTNQNFNYIDDLNPFTCSDNLLYLLNYLIENPQSSNLFIKLLNKIFRGTDNTELLLNNCLKEFIELNYDFTVLHLIGFMVNRNVKIQLTNIKEYLKDDYCNSVVEAAMVAYLIIYYDKSEINDILDDVINKLKVNGLIDFSTENWLTKYILFYYDYIDAGDCIENSFKQEFIQYKINNVLFIDFFNQ